MIYTPNDRNKNNQHVIWYEDHHGQEYVCCLELDDIHTKSQNGANKHFLELYTQNQLNITLF